jgi:hypothetical protein
MTRLYEGIKVRIGQRDYVVPQLSLGQAQRHPQAVQLSKDLNIRDHTAEELDEIVQIVHAAVSRNYPDVTADALLDGLDEQNIRLALAAAAGDKAARWAAARIDELQAQIEAITMDRNYWYMQSLRSKG